MATAWTSPTLEQPGTAIGTERNGAAVLNTDTALLVVDVQVGAGIDGSEPAYQGTAVLDRIGTLIRRARAAGAVVMYVQHDGGPDDPLQSGTGGWALHPSLAPKADEVVVRKCAANAFHRTPLHRELEDRGVRHLVVTGIATDICVDTTCRVAASLGYAVTLVGDAHTTWDHDGLSAAQIVAHHNATLPYSGTPDHPIMIASTDTIVF